MWDDSLRRRIETEDVIWSTWNDGYRSPENRPKHAGSIENEKIIKDFETDLQERREKREYLRKEVRRFEIRGVVEASKNLKPCMDRYIPEKKVRFDVIATEYIVREEAGMLTWLILMLRNIDSASVFY